MVHIGLTGYTLAFIDLGLFEEELTLYGTIGTGIALALAQCEEVDGCAPNVTEDELNTIIATLKARITELEARLAEEENKEQVTLDFVTQLETLIAAYNIELAEFQGYLKQVQEFFAAEEEFEDDGFDEEGVEEDSFLDAQPDADAVSTLAGVLETINSRIQWLEQLKGLPEERAKLSEKTGIDLTEEMIDKLIEAARAEAGFIENRIRLLLESPQTNIGVPSVFTAEARDYNSVHTIHYGPELLKLPETQTMNLF